MCVCVCVCMCLHSFFGYNVFPLYQLTSVFFIPTTATYIMTYRNVLKTSQDFYQSLEKSRHIADKLTQTLRKNGNPNAYVRSYSYPDVFYEQYLTMWNDTLTSLGLSIFAIFVVMFLFLGLDFYSASVITFTIVMIIVNLMGLMYWWDISLNAVSLVNLVVVSDNLVTFMSPTLKCPLVDPRPFLSICFPLSLSRVSRVQIVFSSSSSYCP